PYTEGGDYGVVVLPARPGGSLPSVREARWRRALAPEPARREQAVDHRLEHPQVSEQIEHGVPATDPLCREMRLSEPVHTDTDLLGVVRGACPVQHRGRLPGRDQLF